MFCIEFCLQVGFILILLSSLISGNTNCDEPFQCQGLNITEASGYIFCEAFFSCGDGKVLKANEFYGEGMVALYESNIVQTVGSGTKRVNCDGLNSCARINSFKLSRS